MIHAQNHAQHHALQNHVHQDLCAQSLAHLDVIQVVATKSIRFGEVFYSSPKHFFEGVERFDRSKGSTPSEKQWATKKDL